MSKPIAGSAHLFVDGTNYSTSGDFSGNILAVNREELVDSSGQIYFTETPVASSVTGSIYLTETLTPKVITDMVDGTVQVQLRNGKTALLSNAFYNGDGSFDASAGTMDISFAGKGKFV